MSLDGKVGLIRPVTQAPADFADVPTILNAGAGDGRLVVPGGDALLRAEFFPSGGDLLIVMPDGSRIFVLDYFAAPLPTMLMTEGGAALPYDLVTTLAGPHAPGQYAQSETGLQAAPIGRVDESVGEVTATRADGTTVTLAKDSPVFEGDILETGAGGAVALVFIDETEFSLGEDGRMVLDELIFDPASQEGSSTFSVVQGVFVFVSGEIASHNPDEMVVRTPVATLGIRGTKVAGRAATEGELNTVTMMPEEGGAVTGAITVSTESATITLDTAFQTTAVSSVFDAPADPVTLTAQQAGGLYGAVDRLLPANNADQVAANEAAGDDTGENAEAGEGTDAEAAQADSAEEDAGGEDAAVEEEALAEEEALGEEEDLAEEEALEGDVADAELEAAEGEAENDSEAEEEAAAAEEGAVDGDAVEFAGGAPAPGENVDGPAEAGDAEGPSSEDIAAAELAASDAAFGALEAALAGGATLDSAMEEAMVAGVAAYESIADFGAEGLPADGAFGSESELAADEVGFGPEGFADTLQDGLSGPAPDGPAPGDAEAIEAEQFTAALSDEFGAVDLYDAQIGDSYLGGDFISEPIFDGGFVDGGIYENDVYFDDFTLQDDFFAGEDFLANEEVIVDEPITDSGEDEIIFIENTGPIIETIIGQTGSVRSTSVGGDVFIGNNLIELGVSGAGSFGSINGAPTGFHNPGGLSFVFDVDQFDSGAAPATNDFFLLGTPEEGWSVGFRLTNGGATDVFSNFGRQSIRDVATDTDDVSTAGTAAAETTGTIDGRLDYTQKVEIGAADTFFTTTITLNNLSGSELFDVRYLRNMDPDQEAVLHDEFQTINDVLSNPSGETGVAAVSAKGVNSGISVVLAAENVSGDGIEARASAASALFHRDPYEISHFDSPADANGTTANDAITFVFKVDSIAAGATVSFDYVTTVNVTTSGNDFLIGSAGTDNLSGGLGNDELHALGGNDTLSGDGGNDTLSGGAGNDILNGGSGIDSVTYSNAAAAVTVNLGNGIASDGDGGTDNLSAVENVIGSGNADTLAGSNLNNTLSGGLGDDTLSGAAGNDSLIGGAGNDTASYSAAAAGVSANLATGTASDGDGGTDNLATIESLTGSAHNDTLTGDSQNNTLVGGSGNDTLNGGAGNDRLDGGAGIDTISFSDAGAGVTVTFGSSSASDGDGGTDFLLNNERIIGSDFADSLNGDNFNANTLIGGLGNDTLASGAGNDVLDGGGGTDTVTYVNVNAAVTVDLAAGTTTGSASDTDSLISIENVTGTQHLDTLTGDGQDNVLDGGVSNDTLIGAGGNDTLIGGAQIDTASYASAAGAVTANLATGTASDGDGGTDSLTTIENLIGSANADTLTGDSQANVLNGGDGGDTLIGGAGNDSLIGGGDADIASYLSAAAGVIVNLSTGTASDGDGGTDTLSGIELVVGSNQNDTLTAGATATTFSGELGNDVLNGGAAGDHLKGDGGNDTLTGNGGVDTLQGGAGNDTYVFGEASDIELISDSGGTGDVALIQSGTIGRLVIDPTLLEISRDGGNLVVEEREGNLGSKDVAVFIEDYFTTGTIEAAIFNDVGATPFIAASAATAGNDFIVLTESDVNFSSSAGADIVYASAVSTTLDGNTGDDFLIGGAGTDVLQGHDGNDRLFGAGGNDTLNGDGGGADGNDTLEGGGGNDTLNGGGGNDTYIFSSGDGTDTILDSGGTADTLFLNSDVDYPTAAAFSGTTLTITFRASGGTTYSSSILNHTTTGQIEQISVAADGGGTELLGLSAGGLSVTSGNDFVVGSTGFDTVVGGLGNDVMFGNDGDDDLQGAGGNDFISGGAGNDFLSGGTGIDLVDYATATAGVVVDLSIASVQVIGGGMGNDTLTTFEGVRGSNFGDSLTGDANDNTLIGGDGNDVLSGAAGNDSYYFSDFDGSGVDSVNDASGTDTLIVGRDDEFKLPTDFSFTRSGNNLVFSHEAGTPGSENVTILNHFTTTPLENFEFSGVSGTVFGFTATATSGNDLLIGDLTTVVNADGGLGEDIVVGGNSADSIAGGAGNDFLVGNSGNDQLNGGAGNDEMDGDAGSDTLSGGLGDDIYIFDLETGDTSPADSISDSGGTDTIEVLNTLHMSNAVRSGNNLVFTFDSTGTVTVLDHFAGDALELAEFEALFTDPLFIATGDSGGIANDFIAGTTAADTLAGGDGDDFMFANAGNDVLIGGSGADRMHGGAGADIFRFNSTNELTAVTTNTAVTLDSNLHNSLEDFVSGTDKIELPSASFAGSTFGTIGSVYNGTNSGVGGGSAHFIVDSTGTLYHDNDSATVGYTLIAESGGNAPAVGDISLV